MVRHLFGVASLFTEIHCLEYDHFNGERPLEYSLTRYHNFRNHRSRFSASDKFWLYPVFDFAGVDKAGVNIMGIYICWSNLYSLSICKRPDYRPKGFSSLRPLFYHFCGSHDPVSIAVFWLSSAEHLLCEGVP